MLDLDEAKTRLICSAAAEPDNIFFPDATSLLDAFKDGDAMIQETLGEISQDLIVSILLQRRPRDKRLTRPVAIRNLSDQILVHIATIRLKQNEKHQRLPLQVIRLF